MVLGLAMATSCPGQSGTGSSDPNGTGGSAGRAVIYVMPNALMSADGSNSQVVVDSSHNGKEPQVAKVYQELQHNKSCRDFSENMIKEKANYFLLLQHGGGWGNRWAVSGKDGSVIASGQAISVGKSVTDACMAIAKDWKASAGAAR